MKYLWKRTLALLLITVMLLGNLPTVFAANVCGFTDVKDSDWYGEFVRYVNENSLMNGMSATTFQPNATCTRAMAATVLYRIAGAPSVAEPATFNDLKAAWYRDSVAWAEDEGVANGVGNGRFAPDGLVSREQLLTMIWRFAGAPEADNSNGIGSYPDAGKVSGYAKAAFNWGIENEIINGKDGKLVPAGNATRAEFAKIISVFDKMNEEEEPSEAPTVPATEPTESSEAPTVPTTEPTESSERPTESSEEPTEEPTEEATEPTTEAPTECQHKWNAGEIVLEATCTKDGKKRYTCQKCGETRDESIEATGHNYSAEETPPTCTAKGKVVYTCASCDHSYTETIAAKGHDYEISTTPAGCITTGLETGVCTACADSYEKLLSALGHDYLMTSIAVTCTEPGITTATCKRCDSSYTETITPQGHSYGEALSSIPGTCTTDGSATYKCTVCGNQFTETTPAPGHNYESTQTLPTCDQAGSTVYTCSVCEHSYTETMPPMGHNYESTQTLPTCDQAGYAMYACSICGNSYTETIPPLGHNYESTQTMPTCDQAGSTVYTCSVCGNSYTETIPALGHSYKSTQTLPTCDQAGSTVYTCSVCEHSYTETIAPLGHNYKTVVTAPTCTSKGYSTHTCTRCQDTYTDNEVPKTDHNYGNGVVTKEPTCEKSGTKTFTCSYGCGNSYTETVPATGHSYTNGICSVCQHDNRWSFNAATGELTVRSQAAMDACGNELQPWKAHMQQIISVTIEQGVTSIGNYAFYSCRNLTSVTLGDSVTSIGNRAFVDCANLTSLTLGGSVTSIGNRAFYSCDRLTGIWVDEANQYYSSDASGVLFDKEKTTLIQCPCGYSGAYTIPDSVKIIGNDAFVYCNSLTNITIPNSVTGIGYCAFRYCDSLTNVTIPSSVIYIGNYAFEFCSNLTGIWVDGANQYYSSDANGVLFDKEKTTLIQYPCAYSGAYTILNSVTSIGNRAFYSCNSLTSVTIGDSVTSIGVEAFHSCDSLTSVAIPDSVTSIGRDAFRYCSGLTGVKVLNPECEIYASAYTMGGAGDTTIYGYIGSTAQTYAETYGYTFLAIGSEATADELNEVAFTDLSDGDSIIIVMHSAPEMTNKDYVLLNNFGTVPTNSAAEFDGTFYNDNMTWTVKIVDGIMKLHPTGSSDYLYASNANNGLRVGKEDAGAIGYDATHGYLTVSDTKGNTRYIGIYDNNGGDVSVVPVPSFRSYKLTSEGAIAANIANQTTKIYKVG